MYFKMASATFGKLQQASLTLSPGLNCIYAPNESGKSTWSRFLLCMLYGINTRDRNPLSDKNRYLPWSSQPMQGHVELDLAGIDYAITRSTKRAASPMGEVRCVCSDPSSFPPPDDAEQLGQFFTGVPRSVYERSAFIAQSGLSVTKDAELERRIAALVTTGEENISYSQSMQRLRDQLNRRRYHKSGLIPALETECEALRQQLSQQEALHDALSRTIVQRDRCQKEIDLLQRYQDDWARIRKREESREAALQHERFLEKKAELIAEELSAKTILSSHPLYGKTESELAAMTDGHKPLPLPRLLFLFLWTVLSVLSAAAVSTLVILRHFRPATAAVAAFLASLVALLIHCKKRMNIRRQNTGRASEAATLQEHLQSLHRCQQELASCQRRREDYCALYQSAPSPVSVFDSTAPSAPPVSSEDVNNRLRSAREMGARLQTFCDQTAGQLSSLGSRDILSATLAEKQRALTDLQGEYDAIAMAMENLEKANTVLQNRFSPALGERTAEIFRALTYGRFEKVGMDRDFFLSASGEDQIPRAISLLSQGTADQLYLSARLAICDLVLPEAENAPLILDDVLLTFDDDRLHAALDLLVGLGKSRQILLFTCQHREQEYLRHFDGVTCSTL